MITPVTGTSNQALDSTQALWYALYVRCNQENNVARSLSSRGVEHFLPCYRSRRRWQDRQVTLELPLFPGYVFVRLRLAERNQALSVPHVVSLVGTRSAPSALAEEEIANIKRGLEHGRIEPHDYLNAGQRIVIIEGVMCGMEGILLRKQNGARVVVSLDSISRSFAVEVDANWVKPVTPRYPPFALSVH